MLLNFTLGHFAFFIPPTASGCWDWWHNPGRHRLNPAHFIEIGQIATRRSLSSLRTWTLRVCAIMFEMNRKTEENDGEKDSQENQSDPLSKDIETYGGHKDELLFTVKRATFGAGVRINARTSLLRHMRQRFIG